MSFRYTSTPTVKLQFTPITPTSDNADYSCATQALLIYTRTLSPTMVNDMRLNYTPLFGAIGGVYAFASTQTNSVGTGTTGGNSFASFEPGVPNQITFRTETIPYFLSVVGRGCVHSERLEGQAEPDAEHRVTVGIERRLTSLRHVVRGRRLVFL